ncbi:hypothetical protein A359_03450 [secondary endosymbiont of Ctenarytaina eucalypti]|uniref:Uncharacterized protein n=1 Tax=secondary endosymbiont of Ctenarytaina eucalypti TaxID=1199245 RepID=J3TX82_9ENTR|nr:hypothetical protein A359_03450 [secondary endosymbiont of Ctenarytaina eucalypti]
MSDSLSCTRKSYTYRKYVKLGFKNTPIQPKRSELKNRSAFALQRHLTFKHPDICWSGVPAISVNMDIVGTLNIPEERVYFDILTASTQTLSGRLVA